MIYFAHADHDHNTPAVTPTPNVTIPEPVLSEQPYPSATTTTDSTASATLLNDALIGGGVLLGLIIFWLLTTHVFKLKLATRLSVIMATLLVLGMLSYQAAPITSIVALTLGIVLALSTVLIQLAHKPTQKPKA